jgi:predicted Zn-dependent protease
MIRAVLAALVTAGVGLAALAACKTTDVAATMGTVSRLAQAAPTIQGAFVDIDEPEEVELGRAVTAAIGGRYRLLRDPALTRYVALVGNRVAAESERPDLRYAFAVLDTDEVNAFATPGGFILVTRGALAVMRDEAMLAGVLAHEVAHVALRHGVETIKAEKKKAVAMLGLREGLAHTKASPFSGMISSTADLFAEQVVLKGFSRAEESEADVAGFKYTVQAGYDPRGLRDFLAVMTLRAPKEAPIARFTSTHPGTDERVREQDTLLQQTSGGQRHEARFARAVLRRPAPVAGAAAPQVAAVPPQAAMPTPPAAAPGTVLQAIQASGRYVSHAIVFDTASDRLRPESRAALKEIADALAAAPDLRLLVEGHTDSEGAPQRNLVLSRRRADAVKRALVTEFGVAADRLTTGGVGAQRPIASNDTPEGRATNRRVEFIRIAPPPARR